MGSRWLDRNIWMVYLLFWIAIAFIHFSFDFWMYDQTLFASLADAALSEFVFALLGMGLFFMVRFAGGRKSNLLETVLYYVGGGVFFLFVWQFITYSLLHVIFSHNRNFIAFLTHSLPVRLLVGGSMYFLLLALNFLLASINQMQERAEREAALASMLRDAELNMLRSQIKPHFLFNSLNSISALTLSNPAAARKMIIKLSEFMRYSLKLDANSVTTFGEELYQAELFLGIDRIRFFDKMKFDKKVDENCMGWHMPAMLLQPLLENAVKHGVNTMISACEIHLEAFCRDEMLHISIRNQFDDEGLPRVGTGTGLLNIRQRLISIYGRTDLFTTTSNDGWYEVKLLIPRETLSETNIKT